MTRLGLSTAYEEYDKSTYKVTRLGLSTAYEEYEKKHTYEVTRLGLSTAYEGNLDNLNGPAKNK